MKQQSLTWFSWKKFIIAIVIFSVLLLLIYIFTTNKYIKASKTKGFEQTESVILDQTNMTSVHGMYAFQDDILYHIAQAHDKNNTEWIVYVPKTEKAEISNEEKKKRTEKAVEKKDIKQREIISLETSKLKTQEEIEAIWKQECDQCLLKSSSPAMIDDTPLWELTYIDHNNRFVMEYRHLEDAEIVEQLKLRRKYNVKG